MTKQALILFAHGARAASWAAPFERLRDLTRARLPEMVAQMAAQGIAEVTVVPVFLGQGGHVLRDLPLMVEQLRSDHPQLSFKVVGAAGEDPAVLNALTDYCVNSL